LFSLTKAIINQTKNLFQKIDQNRQKKIAGLRPAPPPYGAAPHFPTQVDAKYLAAVVLDNQPEDRSLRPYR